MIADDHPEVRNAWSLFLGAQKDIEVVAVCTDGDEAIKAVATFLPDIVLMDINMKKTSGIDTTRKIATEYPSVKVIGLSFHSSVLYIKKMIDAGAKGYVIKHNVAEELPPAIQQVNEGKIYLDKEASEAFKN